jgi:DnaJ domain.
MKMTKIFSAKEILAMGAWEADKVLPGDEQAVRRRYRELAKHWHPDLNGDPMASKVLSHLTYLRDALVRKRPPVTDDERLYECVDGTKVRFRFLRKRSGEVGDILIGRRSIAYEMPADFADIAENEKSSIASLRFADDRMKAHMEHFLPQLEKTYVTKDRVVSLFVRPSDCVLLSDLIDFYGGRIPPEHVAWIVSRLENICCYLEWMELSHGAISPSNVLVCPEKHTVVLVGGWGFATRFGGSHTAVPERTLSRVPRLAVEGVAADALTDLHLVRATAQDALGPSKGGLMMDRTIPEPLSRWLLLPPKAGAVTDYESWGRCLREAWGERRFVKMEADPRKIYAS